MYSADLSLEGQERAPNSSPAGSFSSDKENRPSEVPKSTYNRGMPPPLPQASVAEATTSRRYLKRKLADRDAPPSATQTLHRQRLEEAGNSEFYDPEQSMGQRRALRREYRDLTRELTGSITHTPCSQLGQKADSSCRLSRRISGAKLEWPYRLTQLIERALCFCHTNIRCHIRLASTRINS